MTEDKPAPSAMQKALESAGAVARIVMAVLLALSTAYDFSFLYALGLTFEELPTSLTDHVRSAIVWAPRALVYVAVFAAFEMLTTRIDGGRSEEELIAEHVSSSMRSSHANQRPAWNKGRLIGQTPPLKIWSRIRLQHPTELETDSRTNLFRREMQALSLVREVRYGSRAHFRGQEERSVVQLLAGSAADDDRCTS